MVFGNAALQEMAFYLPQSLQSFAAIAGVGDAKLATYGDVFVAEIGAYAAENGLSERAPPPTRSPRSSPGRQTVSTYEATMALILEGLNVGEIARRRGLSQQTVLTHLERLVARGERLELDHLMPTERRFRRIEHAFRAVGGEFLTPVRDVLSESFSYKELRLVRLRLNQDGDFRA